MAATRTASRSQDPCPRRTSRLAFSTRANGGRPQTVQVAVLPSETTIHRASKAKDGPLGRARKSGGETLVQSPELWRATMPSPPESQPCLVLFDRDRGGNPSIERWHVACLRATRPATWSPSCALGPPSSHCCAGSLAPPRPIRSNSPATRAGQRRGGQRDRAKVAEAGGAVTPESLPPIIGEAPAMRRVRELI